MARLLEITTNLNNTQQRQRQQPQPQQQQQQQPPQQLCNYYSVYGLPPLPQRHFAFIQTPTYYTLT
jgi:hypothetical protein